MSHFFFRTQSLPEMLSLPKTTPFIMELKYIYNRITNLDELHHMWTIYFYYNGGEKFFFFGGGEEGHSR